MFFEVVTDDINETLPAQTTALWGKKSSPVVMAQLLTAHAIVAPSAGSTHPTGLPYEAVHGSFATDLPELTIADVDAIATLLVEVSDSGIHDSVTTLYGWTTGARQVRAAYRHVSTPQESLDLLRKHKWTVVKGELPGEVCLSRPGSTSGDVHAKIGGARRQYGQALVLTSNDDVLPRGPLDAFELNALLEHGGNAEKGAWALRSRVHMPHLILSAAFRPFVNVSTSHDSNEIRGALVNAVASARSTVDLNAPMVLRHVDANDAAVGLVIPRRGLPPLQVSNRNPLGLFLRVCQPIMGVKDVKGDDGKPTGHTEPVFSHTIPDGLMKIAFDDALESEAVNTVRMFATEPVLLPSGKVVSKPGYHAAEQILISIPQRDVNRWTEEYVVPERPTREQAQAAFDLLATDVLGDFPFTDEGDLARAVLMLLCWACPTLVKKRTPWMVTAPDRGTGKSLLCEVGRVIATGSALAVEIVPFKSQDEENRKNVAAGVLAGVRFISADNVTTGAKFNSEFVTLATTKGDGEIPIRILGTNDYTYPSGLTFVFAGNSIAPGGDLNRRFMPINLEVKYGLAFERTGFKHRNLLQYVHDNRPKLLAAVHTILLHGLQNPKEPAWSLGGFEQWSDVYVSALTHLDVTFTDEDVDTPGQTVVKAVNAGTATGKGRDEFVDANDEEAEDWGELLEYLTLFTKNKPRAAGEIVEAIFPINSPRPRLDLPLAVLDIAKWPTASRAKKMGNELSVRRNAKFPYGDKIYKLVCLSPRGRGSSSKKSNLWTVEVMERRVKTTPTEAVAADATPSSEATRDLASWPTAPDDLSEHPF